MIRQDARQVDLENNIRHKPPFRFRRQPRFGVHYTADMSYQVLARSWRPQQFSDVIAQDAVVKTLHNALSSETLGHAYLFSGLRGVGKTTVARLLAKAVNCERGPTVDTCGVCASCVEVATSSSLDVVELDGASHRGIDDVRELNELLRFSPVRDRFRVIIIDEVHMLTREAFNALLKSLEEPPSYILFIFATTEIHRVPPTILSRCQQMEFRPVPQQAIADHLLQIAESEDFELTREAAATIARAAQGSVRDALSLADQLRAFSGDHIDADAVTEVLGVPRFEAVLGLIKALSDGDAASGLEMLRAELVAGHDAWVLYQEAGRILRLLLHLAVNPELAQDLTDEQRGAASALASSLGAGALTRMAGLWLDHEHLVASASNRELALDVACLRLARWPAVQRVESMLAGETPPQAEPAGGVDEAGSGGHSPATPGGRLSSALWEQGQRRLAGVVEGSQVEVRDETVVLTFAADSRVMATAAATEYKARLLETCREVFGERAEFEVEINGRAVEQAAGDDSLVQKALDDEGVMMVRRILGGEVVDVSPNGGVN